MTRKYTVALTATLSLVLVAFAAVAQPAAPPLYHGEAFGSRAVRFGEVLADESAPATIRCGADYLDNTAYNIDGGALYQIQQVTNVVTGFDNGGTLTTTSTSNINGVSLLDGLVTASSLTAVSNTTWSNGNFSINSAGTSFGSVSVGGLPVVNFPPNKRYPIPGVGWVVINEMIRDLSPESTSLRVNMLHVFITVTGPFGEAGTQIVVGSALSRLEHVPGTLNGFAYGTSSFVPGGASSSPSALIDMPCGGTNGKLKSRRVVGMDAWPGVTTGMIANTAVGLTDSDVVLGETTSTVFDIEVLDGRVRVDSLVARAELSSQDGDLELGGAAFFTNLVIDGLDMPNEFPPDTLIYLPGIGDVGINMQVSGEDERVVTQRFTVKALEILVTETNPLGLPIGTRIEVGTASVALAQ